MAPVANGTPYSSLVLGFGSTRVNGANRFDLEGVEGTVVRFDTNANRSDASFAVELFDKDGISSRTTPQTVANFLGYVNDGSYRSSIIHRSIANFVVQGGGFTAPTVASDQPGSDPATIPSRDPVVNEPGNSNLRGTIAMAKLGGQPDSATNQWYVNLGDNSRLDGVDGGFTVFGRVIGSGMEVVDQIAGAPTYDASSFYGNGALTDLPLWQNNNPSVIQPSEFVTIDAITQLSSDASLFTYSVEVSDPSVLEASVDGEGTINLSLKQASASPVLVTVTASNRYGDGTSSQSFEVITSSDRRFVSGSPVRDLTAEWLSSCSCKLNTTQQEDLAAGTALAIEAPGWSAVIAINRVARASAAGADLQAQQLAYTSGSLPSSQSVEIAGSILEGSDQGETLRGLAGWDILDAKGGDDLVHGGNGRDIIMGGTGADELHGDFGWNTYTDQRDGSDDLIAIKSDQFLVNWWYGTDGNSPNGEKADIIEGLDATDEIRILGVSTDELSFMDATAHGVQGIGIYADGALEAVYTGGNLSTEQLQSMTTGDNSEAVMNNQLWSYNFGNEVPPVI